MFVGRRDLGPRHRTLSLILEEISWRVVVGALAACVKRFERFRLILGIGMAICCYFFCFSSLFAHVMCVRLNRLDDMKMGFIPPYILMTDANTASAPRAGGGGAAPPPEAPPKDE